MVKIQRSPASPPPSARRKPFLPVRVVWAPVPLAKESRGGVGFGSVPPPSFAAYGARIRRRRAEPLSGPLGAVFFGRRSDGRAPEEGPRKRRPRSKSRRFAAFRISRHLSHLAASFVVGRPEVSIAKSRFSFFWAFFTVSPEPPPRRGGVSPPPPRRKPVEGFLASNRGTAATAPEAIGSSGRGFPPPSAATRTARVASSSPAGGEVIFSLSSRTLAGPAPCAAPETEDLRSVPGPRSEEAFVFFRVFGTRARTGLAVDPNEDPVRT